MDIGIGEIAPAVPAVARAPIGAGERSACGAPLPIVSSSQRSIHQRSESGPKPWALSSAGMAAESPRVRKKRAFPVTSTLLFASTRTVSATEVRIVLCHLEIL